MPNYATDLNLLFLVTISSHSITWSPLYVLSSWASMKMVTLKNVYYGGTTQSTWLLPAIYLS